MKQADVDLPAVVEEITALFDRYESALMANDLAALDAFFWPDERLTRYGIADRQWGVTELRAFRAATPAPTFTRRLEHLRVSAFGPDCAVAQVEFVRSDTPPRSSSRERMRSSLSSLIISDRLLNGSFLFPVAGNDMVAYFHRQP